MDEGQAPALANHKLGNDTGSDVVSLFASLSRRGKGMRIAHEGREIAPLFVRKVQTSWRKRPQQEERRETLRDLFVPYHWQAGALGRVCWSGLCGQGRAEHHRCLSSSWASCQSARLRAAGRMGWKAIGKDGI